MEKDKEKTYDPANYYGGIKGYEMEKIENCMRQLIDSIKQSEVYQEYVQYEADLEKDPELKRQIDEFRVSAYHMNTENEEDLFEQSDRLQKIYEPLRKNAKVNAYLEAELSLCRLLQNVSNQIDAEVGLKVPEI